MHVKTSADRKNFEVRLSPGFGVHDSGYVVVALVWLTRITQVARV